MTGKLNPIGGNTFGLKTFSSGRGQHVWREIRNQYPAGGTLAEKPLSKAKSIAGGFVLPAGTPVTLSSYSVVPFLPYDETATYEVGEGVIAGGALYVCKTKITTAESFTAAKWTAVSAIQGFTADDVVIEPTTTAASVTVVYDGELYKYMYAAADIAGLTSAAPKTIVFVE